MPVPIGNNCRARLVLTCEIVNERFRNRNIGCATGITAIIDNRTERSDPVANYISVSFRSGTALGACRALGALGALGAGRALGAGLPTPPL